MKRWKLTKACALLLALSMFFALSGCTRTGDSGEKNGDSGEKKTLLNVGLDSTLDTLSPWGTLKPSWAHIVRLLYQPLGLATEYGSTDIVGVLMKEYEQLDDYRYQITLYDYIYDTAGNHFTASDAIFSIEAYGALNSSYVESTELVSEDTFIITLNSSAPDVFQNVCQNIYMCTEAAYNASADGLAATACGTSQYELTDFVSGSHVTISKTDSYWQKEDLNHPFYVANVDVINFLILTEVTQLGVALEQGTIQMGYWIDYSILDDLQANDSLSYMEVPCNETRNIMLNMTEDSPFYDNLALRQAVLYAIDNEAIIEATCPGHGTVSPVVISSPLEAGYNTEWETYPYSYDPEKAQELLAEAGYKPGELTLRLLSNTNPVHQAMWEVIQANLIAIGINAEINTCDGSTYGGYRDATSGQYEIATSGQLFGSHVTSLWNYTFNAEMWESGRTWFGLDDPELQELFQTIIAPGGFTQDNIDAFYHRVEEGAYYYQIFMMPNYCIYSNAVDSVLMDSQCYIRANTVVLSEDYNVFTE